MIFDRCSATGPGAPERARCRLRERPLVAATLTSSDSRRREGPVRRPRSTG